MDSIKNSELLDLDDLDSLDEYELNLFFTYLIDFISLYKTVFQEEVNLNEFSQQELIDLDKYFQKILDIFLEWELFDYVEDIHIILVEIESRIQNYE